MGRPSEKTGIKLLPKAYLWKYVGNIQNVGNTTFFYSKERRFIFELLVIMNDEWSMYSISNVKFQVCTYT